MKLFADTSSFTLAVIPDSGHDTKSGSADHHLVAAGFGLLLVIFFACLFFVAGYHVKLSQENGYRAALTTMQQYLDNIERNEELLMGLVDKMTSLQNLDRAFRQYAALEIPDDDMYRAGIGGHLLFDDTAFRNVDENLYVSLRELFLGTRTLEAKAHLEMNSLGEIQASIEARNDLINNTPSILPTQSLNITSGFGTRRHPTTGKTEFHEAVDFTAPLGTKIFATADGVVVEAGPHNIRGNYVTIRHKYGYSTMYAHLHTILVEVGQEVHKRDVIGTMGKTGRATGVNLHYTVSLNGRKVNPLDYF